MKRKLLSITMIAALCLTMLPTAGWAADETIDDWQEPTFPTMEDSWTDEDNYDISWYNASATSFELSDAEDLAGLAMITNGELTAGDFEVYATLGGDYDDDERVLDDFSGKTITLKENTTFDLSEHEWTPIGTFRGNFDGSSNDGTMITGMTITKAASFNVGFFSSLDNAVVENINITNANVKGINDNSKNKTGGIAGTNLGSEENRGIIKNCSFSGNISAVAGKIDTYVGGIVGSNGRDNFSNGDGIVENCTFDGCIYVTGTGIQRYVGGIVGFNGDTVQNCKSLSSAKIYSETSNGTGGIVGAIMIADADPKDATYTVQNCTNNAKIAGRFAGGIVGAVIDTTNDATRSVKIESCTNNGSIENVVIKTSQGSENKYISYRLGGILGSFALSMEVCSVTMEKCYNTGAVTMNSEENDYTCGFGGLVGAISDANSSSHFTLSNCYNVGTVTNKAPSGNNAPTGGLIGSVDQGQVKLSDSYNAGKIESVNTQSGGIVGLKRSNSTATLTDVWCWNGCGATNLENSKTANQLTEDSSWLSELGFDTNVWEQSTNVEPTGYLPVLKNNKQNPAPYLTRTAKQDQTGFAITRKPTEPIYEKQEPFTLSTTGGAEGLDVTWSSSDEDVAIVSDSGQVTINGVGQVTITAKKAGNDQYNEASDSYTFTVYGTPITAVEILNLVAPVSGATSVQCISVPEDANYKALTSLGIGEETLDVIWQVDGEEFSGTFVQNKTYTATIKLQADECYSFADEVTATLQSINENAYSSLSVTKDDELPDCVVVTVTFKPTDHVHNFDESTWKSDALHHWHPCLTADCPLTPSAMDGYALHSDADNDDKCDTCEAMIGYTITFDAAGGDCDTASVRTDLDGKIATLPEASRDGYTFRGWFTAASGGEQVTTETVYSADTTLYAQWEKIPEPPYTGKYSYEIFTDDSDHGALDVDRYATEGEKVTITVLPDDGYALDEIVITDKHSEEIDFVDNGDGTITFTMPSGDVTITATFAESDEPECALPFVDVHANDWFFDPVCYVYREGLMTGTSATTFAPDATTTRAMIVSILARLENVASAEDAGFTDVAENDWFATAVNWAAREGIVAGFEDESFRPNEAITREQLAAILCNYSAWKGEDTSARADLDEYTDAISISSWATDTMSWAVAEQLLAGVTENTLEPQGAATRAQVAAVLQRFLSE